MWKQMKNASAGNRTRVTSMATMYSTTKPLMRATVVGFVFTKKVLAAIFNEIARRFPSLKR